MSLGIEALGIDFSASKASGKAMLNGFGQQYMRAVMIASGGFSGGISSIIAGGKFIDGFKQGLITSGLNHVAHMTVEAMSTVSFENLDEIKEKYPRFYKVLTKLQEYVSGNADVTKAFMDNSGMSRSEMLALLNIDNLDNIPLEVKDIIVETQNANGKVLSRGFSNVGGNTSSDAPFKITINRWRVLVLEKLTVDKAINAYSFALAVTTLHELVHYARDIKGLDSNYEYGVGFEKQAFGSYWPYDENLFKINNHGWKFK